MAKKWRDLVARMSPESRARSAALAEQMMREMPLVEVRRQMNLSQKAVADRMGTSRSSISRLERESEVHLRELHRYVEALGGELDITARFSEGEVPLHEWVRRVSAR
jgi:DNA-binding XRE family transcriptional regulator